MEAWVAFTLLAATMQTVRTAGQKRLAGTVSPMAATFARYLFGLPFAIVYLVFVFQEASLQSFANSFANHNYVLNATLASVAQLLATYWLVLVLSRRSFAVGTIFSKTETIQAAIWGSVFYSAFLSIYGWIAIVLGSVGILLISLPNKLQDIDGKSIQYGLLSGIGFAFSGLWLREASTSLDHSFIENAAITLVYSFSVQTLLCGFFIFVKERTQLAAFKANIPLALFIGVTSALGSVGWYTAMTYANVALVRALGQIEVIFAIAITYAFFGERISVREMLGIAAISISVIILLLYV